MNLHIRSAIEADLPAIGCGLLAGRDLLHFMSKLAHSCKLRFARGPGFATLGDVTDLPNLSCGLLAGRDLLH